MPGHSKSALEQLRKLACGNGHPRLYFSRQRRGWPGRLARRPLLAGHDARRNLEGSARCSKLRMRRWTSSTRVHAGMIPGKSASPRTIPHAVATLAKGGAAREHAPASASRATPPRCRACGTPCQMKATASVRPATCARYLGRLTRHWPCCDELAEQTQGLPGATEPSLSSARRSQADSERVRGWRSRSWRCSRQARPWQGVATACGLFAATRLAGIMPACTARWSLPTTTY